MGASPAGSPSPAPASAAQAAEGFLHRLAQRNASPNTLRSYRADLDAYLGWCARSDVDPIGADRRALRSYLGYLNAAGYSRTTVNRHLSAVRGFFGWLVDEGVLRNDPTTTLSSMKRPARLPRRIPPAEMTRILAVHGPRDASGAPRPQTPSDLRDQAVLELLYASGCRVSEAAGLRLRDVDLARGQVKVLGKGGKERIVPIHAIAVASLRRYLDEARPALLRPDSPAQALFISDRGRAYSADLIRRMFHATLAAAGVTAGYTPHDMRHTFASDLLEGGADLRSVQELLGHASPSTTQIYTHVTPDYLRRVHDRSLPRG